MSFTSKGTARTPWIFGSKLFHLLRRRGLLSSRKQQGGKVQYHPGATVRHQIATSSQQLQNKTILERHKSIWHYYRKHFKRNVVKDIAIGAGIVGRCAILLLLNQFNMKNAQKV